MKNLYTLLSIYSFSRAKALPCMVFKHQLRCLLEDLSLGLISNLEMPINQLEFLVILSYLIFCMLKSTNIDNFFSFRQHIFFLDLLSPKGLEAKLSNFLFFIMKMKFSHFTCSTFLITQLEVSLWRKEKDIPAFQNLE